MDEELETVASGTNWSVYDRLNGFGEIERWIRFRAQAFQVTDRGKGSADVLVLLPDAFLNELLAQKKQLR